MLISTLYSFIHSLTDNKEAHCVHFFMSHNRHQLFFHLLPSTNYYWTATSPAASHSQLIFSSFTDDTQCHEEWTQLETTISIFPFIHALTIPELWQGRERDFLSTYKIHLINKTFCRQIHGVRWEKCRMTTTAAMLTRD